VLLELLGEEQSKVALLSDCSLDTMFNEMTAKKRACFYPVCSLFFWSLFSLMGIRKANQSHNFLNGDFGSLLGRNLEFKSLSTSLIKVCKR